MKKITMFVLIALLLLAAGAGWGANSITTAIGGVSTSGQVACGGGGIVLLKDVTVPTVDTGRVSLIFQNQSSPVVAVYISPSAAITTSTAGIVLDATHGMSVTLDRSNGNVAWYCRTAGGVATVGWTEEK